MQPELEQQLLERFPNIFSERTLPPDQTAMCFGIMTGDGWFQLLDALCTQLQCLTDTQDAPQVVAAQVKEKTGTLRFYVRDADDRQRAMIALASEMSGRTCDVCGAPGTNRLLDRIRATRCDLHGADESSGVDDAVDAGEAATASSDDEQHEAIALFFDSVAKLKSTGVVRSDKYLGDIAEFLCKKNTGMTLAASQRQPGHDGLRDGERIQVKFSGGKSTTIEAGDPEQYDVLYVVLGPDSSLRKASDPEGYVFLQIPSSVGRMRPPHGDGKRRFTRAQLDAAMRGASGPHDAVPPM